MADKVERQADAKFAYKVAVWSVILNAILVLLAVCGIWLAGERRIAAQEMRTAVLEQRVMAIEELSREMRTAVKMLTDNQQDMIQNQARLAVIVDLVSKQILK